jgi:transposase
MRVKMQAPEQVVGIDVASQWLDINQYGHSAVPRIANEAAAIQRWLAEVPVGSAIGFEATGRYHLLLATLAHAAGMQVYLLNPREVHHYARGVGRRSKSDKVDAQLIARYIAHERDHLRLWQPPSEGQQRIHEAFLRRSKLVKLKQALAMTGKAMTDADEPLAEALAKLQALIDHLEAQIHHYARQQADTYARQQALQSIVGIGSLSAAYLANLFARVPFRTSDQVVSFLGMDLRFADSGKKQGQRRLSKRGPSEARRLLYNAAASAARSCFAPVFARYRERLPYTGAIMALARKLVRIAFALWQSGQPFEKSRFVAAEA